MSLCSQAVDSLAQAETPVVELAVTQGAGIPNCALIGAIHINSVAAMMTLRFISCDSTDYCFWAAANSAAASVKACCTAGSFDHAASVNSNCLACCKSAISDSGTATCGVLVIDGGNVGTPVTEGIAYAGLFRGFVLGFPM